MVTGVEGSIGWHTQVQGYAPSAGAKPFRSHMRTSLTVDVDSVNVDRIYVDHALTRRSRDRPGLRETLATCRCGDTPVITKLDHLDRHRQRAGHDKTNRSAALHTALTFMGASIGIR